jgi:hypothetical protein
MTSASCTVQTLILITDTSPAAILPRPAPSEQTDTTTVAGNRSQRFIAATSVKGSRSGDQQHGDGGGNRRTDKANSRRASFEYELRPISRFAERAPGRGRIAAGPSTGDDCG